MSSLEQPQADGVVWSRLSKVVGWWVCRERLVQFVKFCLVGGSGVVVDMGMLFLLADPKCLGLNVTLSKVLAAETALVNNFIWNELWTFRSTAAACGSRSASGGEGRGEVGPGRFQGSWFGRFGAVARRFLVFNGICGIGIGLAVLLLHLFHTWLGWNLYLANLLAIGLVTLWNFGLNAWLNWPLAAGWPVEGVDGNAGAEPGSQRSGAGRRASWAVGQQGSRAVDREGS
jgi:putative flippase GtrA